MGWPFLDWSEIILQWLETQLGFSVSLMIGKFGELLQSNTVFRIRVAMYTVSSIAITESL